MAKHKKPPQKGDKREREIREPAEKRGAGEKPKDGGEKDTKEDRDTVDAKVHAKVVEERDEATKLAVQLKQEKDELSHKLDNQPELQEGTLYTPPGMLVTPNGHALGWKPSFPDFHDLAADATGLRVLDEVDPRADMPMVYDQGQLGSCTANAIAAALEYECILDDTHFGTPSRLFIYYMERLREGSVTSDSGAYGRDGFKVLRKTGAPPEDLWPYDIEAFAEKPDEESYQAATEHKIAEYVHPGLGARRTLIEREEAFKRLLSNRQTIAFGFTVYESFEESWSEQGVMPVPQKGESILGGHEVLAVGYLSEYPEHALVRNSWGPNWGVDGYFLMPWRFLCDAQFSGDWRSIYRAQGQ